MSNRSQEVRCKRCNALLALKALDGLSIRRGGLQATINGTYHVSLVCYRPGCGTLNVTQHTPAPAEAAA